MKKIISALSILAIVGSALAFSPRFSSNFCTATPNSNGTCPSACTTKLSGYNIQAGGTVFCHVAVPTNGSCSGVSCGTIKDPLVQEPPVR
jgi:hypothetical protein